MMATINLVRERIQRRTGGWLNRERVEREREREREREWEKQAAHGKRKVLDGKRPSTRGAGEQRVNNRRDQPAGGCRCSTE
jgi:hypothetical protein